MGHWDTNGKKHIHENKSSQKYKKCIQIQMELMYKQFLYIKIREMFILNLAVGWQFRHAKTAGHWGQNTFVPFTRKKKSINAASSNIASLKTKTSLMGYTRFLHEKQASCYPLDIKLYPITVHKAVHTQKYNERIIIHLLPAQTMIITCRVFLQNAILSWSALFSYVETLFKTCFFKKSTIYRRP